MTVEPVFGIIKEVMGFRRFSFRGEAQVKAEWALVCTAYNIKRIFNLINQREKSVQTAKSDITEQNQGRKEAKKADFLKKNHSDHPQRLSVFRRSQTPKCLTTPPITWAGMLSDRLLVV